jgi:hypothetical protein
MVTASYHTQVCFDAWINCENLLVNLAEVKTSISKKITKVIDECAMICMGTFHALKSKSTNANRLAILCVGICEECADLCENLKGENFRQCARICRQCSETMTQLAFTDLQ